MNVAVFLVGQRPRRLVLGTTMLGVMIATGDAAARPWAIAGLLLFLALLGVTWTVVWLRSDRRHATRSGKGTPPPWDWDSVCIPVPVRIDSRRALLMAETVVRNTGAMEVRVSGDTVVGWLGREYFGRVEIHASRQGYEVGIAVRSLDGYAELLCCARTQLSMAVVGESRVRELATTMAMDVAARGDLYSA
jgi:hypothetical protein